jgi:hypothetical protein
VGGEQGNYIFADLLGAEVQGDDAQWRVALKVKDATHPVWVLPMESPRQARQWARIFLLAVEQKL